MQDFQSRREFEPNIDAYGTYRVSAIADYLELLAVHESRLLRADIADYINDVSWGSRADELFVSSDVVADGADDQGEGLGNDAGDAADRVFLLLNGRAAMLGESYPFSIDPRSRWIEVGDLSPTPYLAILSITIAHAFGLITGIDPKNVFEDTVARALASVGHKSLNFARFRRNASSFETALMEAGSELDLAPLPEAAWTSSRAQDAGCDVLAHVASGYVPGNSEGSWTLVGQVTCGRSNTWKQKLYDVEVPAWRDRLGTLVPPQAFLAIPHHAETNHLRALVKNNERIVLDRMRLTTMLNDVSSDELDIFTAVTNNPVARLNE